MDETREAIEEILQQRDQNRTRWEGLVEDLVEDAEWADRILALINDRAMTPSDVETHDVASALADAMKAAPPWPGTKPQYIYGPDRREP